MSAEPGDHFWYWNGNVSRSQNIPQSAWFPGFSGPTDYLGHGKEIYQFVLYDEEIVRGQPHMRNYGGSFAWLNNNPGNLTGVSGGADYGQYPGKFNWHNFLIFPDWSTGYDAISSFLRGPSYASLSLLDAFRRYAPASDGNTPDVYAADVAAAVGASVDDPMSSLGEEQMIAVQNKISEIEGAVPGDTFTYDSPEIPAEVAAELA